MKNVNMYMGIQAANVVMREARILRDDAQTTSAPSRGGSKSDKRKRCCVDLALTRGREGVQNPEILEDVICACPLYAYMSASEANSSYKRCHSPCESKITYLLQIFLLYRAVIN